jgi:hypothetical protein
MKKVNDENDDRELPEEVMERLNKHCERTGDKIEDVVKHYTDFISTYHGCEDWASEDEDLLIDWAEQCFTQLRKSTVGGGANTVSFVGCFIGVDGTKRDRRAGMVSRATREFITDPKAAIDGGRVGVYEKEGSFWQIRTNKGVQETNEPVEEDPTLGFKADNKFICLLGMTTGRPMMPMLFGRHYYFLGNEESSFDNEILMWRVDGAGSSVDMNVRIGEPCKIKVRPPNTDGDERFRDVLGTNAGFEENIQYTDDFVDEQDRKFLHPHKFLASNTFHEHYIPLESLNEAYNERVRTFQINGEEGRAGPIVVTKGTVSRLNTEPRESPYDETGRNFMLSLSNVALQSIHGQGRKSEVTGWVSGACYDLSNPFVARKGDEEIEWAEKSTVIVVGRIGMSIQDGEEVPKLNVFGVYADPRRIRRRQEGGDTNMEQFI